ncbi:LppU/SCO3897 family protein [Streptomyces beijiangensis]|uniref:Uncharacterized protein n=1 Tax=Streptomyces beijiangensis TaxID=163361 RepID=A0A939F4M6_9ACTN|nr:hypothetical protein [Streptomyces beijiangensis]MBO0511828.1 hypothetical protein [Streptomyces beijiangensis]
MSTPPPQGQNPYAQQPTTPSGQQPQGGNPYAQQQPGVPPQQSPYMNQGGPIPQAPVGTPPRGGGFKKFRNIALPIIAVVVIAGGWWASRDDADTAKVGDCMSISNADSATDPGLEVVDCGDAKAKYKVAEKKDGSGDCDRTKYSQYRESGKDDFTLCLSDYKK